MLIARHKIKSIFLQLHNVWQGGGGEAIKPPTPPPPPITKGRQCGCGCSQSPSSSVGRSPCYQRPSQSPSANVNNSFCFRNYSLWSGFALSFHPWPAAAAHPVGSSQRGNCCSGLLLVCQRTISCGKPTIELKSRGKSGGHELVVGVENMSDLIGFP